MIYIERKLTDSVVYAVKYFPVIVVTGPRQSGKSSFCEHVFNNYTKYNFEDISLREAVAMDPKAFLAGCGTEVIIDEVQHVPELLSYIQIEVDNNPDRKFVLTGSSNFTLLPSVTQSLAGRCALFTLLPFSLDETGEYAKNSTDTLLLNGLYPSVVTGKRPAPLFYPAYNTTYVERDLRQIKNITDLGKFQLFMRLVAGRCGTEFNASQLSNEIGVSVPTIQSWMSVIQTSYIAFLLPPYYTNLKKRLTKTPKVYFYDTGLLCYLLGIENESQLATHPLRGAVFENLAVLELLKERCNAGKAPNLFFYRENSGTEVDLLRQTSAGIDAFEFKSAQTFTPGFTTGLKALKKLLGEQIQTSTVVYDGETLLPLCVNIRDLTRNF